MERSDVSAKQQQQNKTKDNGNAHYRGLIKVISGGQTGADRGGLEAAKEVGIPTGGYAPKNWFTDNGSDISLRDLFGLEESYTGYAGRTRLNVEHSEATLVIRLHPGEGTDKTIGYCHTGQWVSRTTSFEDGFRPVLVLTSVDEEMEKENVSRITDFLKKHSITVLNVAGHRESTAGIADFSKKVRRLLTTAFHHQVSEFKLVDI